MKAAGAARPGTARRWPPGTARHPPERTAAPLPARTRLSNTGNAMMPPHPECPCATAAPPPVPYRPPRPGTL